MRIVTRGIQWRGRFSNGLRITQNPARRGFRRFARHAIALLCRVLLHRPESVLSKIAR
jgi:hypothetical protein